MDIENSNVTRRGFKLYRHNPSLMDLPTRHRKVTKNGRAYVITPDTGEVLDGAFGFVAEKEVDPEEFVKIYLAGIRRYGELSKAGALLFEFVYRKISGREGKDKDTVDLNYLLAVEWKSDLTLRTYKRGMSELLEKGFLFRSYTADTYFVNVRFMFNGNRMVLVESYRRKGSTRQAELTFDEPQDERVLTSDTNLEGI